MARALLASSLDVGASVRWFVGSHVPRGGKMSKTQFAVQMGMGTDLKGQDYTKAACRAVHDALHRNFLSIGQAFDFPVEAMLVDVRIGVTRPDEVDLARVQSEVPYGFVTVEAVSGGLEIEMMGHNTIVANAIISVSYNIEKKD
jgi:uncharacterized protein (TIGR02058 family)